jgi:hypothetical protein
MHYYVSLFHKPLSVFKCRKALWHVSGLLMPLSLLLLSDYTLGFGVDQDGAVHVEI